MQRSKAGHAAGSRGDAATPVYAVRHGETEWNVSGRQQGHLDSPLTANGIEQARALAAGLAHRGIEYIYSSDLGRARNTADIIADTLALPVTEHQGLRERHLGSMQGLTMLEFEQRFPDEHRRYATYDPDYAFPGGESARQRHERNVAACNEIVSAHAGSTVLLVAHGGVLNSLISHTLGLDIAAPRRFSLHNGVINRFAVVDGAWYLETWGERAHLGDRGTLDDA